MEHRWVGCHDFMEFVYIILDCNIYCLTIVSLLKVMSMSKCSHWHASISHFLFISRRFAHDILYPAGHHFLSCAFSCPQACHVLSESAICSIFRGSRGKFDRHGQERESKYACECRLDPQTSSALTRCKILLLSSSWPLLL